MKKIKLSIVIPVYNMEKYLKRCLDSIILDNNEVKEMIEVVVVNDGSVDNSKKIIQLYDWHGFNHIELNKENGGLSDARNYGFNYANGEYVWFIDSDDWIEKNCISQIIPLLDGIDAIHFPSYFQQFDDRYVIKSGHSSGNSGRELTQGEYQYPVQFTIYRKEFLKDNNLSFQYGILMEDLHFSPRALYKADTVRVLSTPVYHYYQRPGSIMKSNVSKKRLDDRIWISRDLYNFMLENVLKEDRKKWAECIVTDVNAIMFDAFRSHDYELMMLSKQFVDRVPYLTEWLRFSKNRNNRIWYWTSRILCGNYFNVYSVLFKLRYGEHKGWL